MLALQWFSKLRALVAIKKGSTFLWYCSMQASLFITIFFAYDLCAIMTHFSGRYGALNDIERIFAYEHVRSHVLYRSFGRNACRLETENVE